jgi:hypothetical protein
MLLASQIYYWLANGAIAPVPLLNSGASNPEQREAMVMRPIEPAIKLSKWTVASMLLALWTTLGCTMPVAESPTSKTPESPPTAADPATLLPSLSPAVLQQREAELTERIDSEYALAGVGKILNLGKPIDPELEEFRLVWAEQDPAIAPFLGTWVRDWDLMPYDFVTVLPSTVPGQVCLVRYRQMETETVPFETFTTPPEFSVGLVRDGQLLGRDLQTTTSLIRLTPATDYVPYDAELLGTLEADGELRLLASQQPPTLDPAWDAGLVEQINTYGCSMTAAPLANSTME